MTKRPGATFDNGFIFRKINKNQKRKEERGKNLLEIIPFIHLDKHLNGAGGTLGIKITKDYSESLQMKSFGPKKFKFHAWVKKCHFGNFSEIR